MKISQAFRTAYRTVSEQKTEALKFLTVEIALTGICLSPLLFLTEKGWLQYLAALCAPLWLLVKIPARLNAAAAMQDSLGEGKLFSLRLADPGNYGRKIGYAFSRLGLLILWSLPLIGALIFAWDKYSGDTDGLTVMNMIYEFGGQDMKTGVIRLLLILAGLLILAALGETAEGAALPDLQRGFPAAADHCGRCRGDALCAAAGQRERGCFGGRGEAGYQGNADHPRNRRGADAAPAADPVDGDGGLCAGTAILRI